MSGVSTPGRCLRLKGSQKLPIQAGEWFKLEIVAKGNRTIVKLNGTTTVDHTDTKNEYPTSGAIALHVRNNKTTVEFRKIEIKEWKAGAAAPP